MDCVGLRHSIVERLSFVYGNFKAVIVALMHIMFFFKYCLHLKVCFLLRVASLSHFCKSIEILAFDAVNAILVPNLAERSGVLNFLYTNLNAWRNAFGVDLCAVLI